MILNSHSFHSVENYKVQLQFIYLYMVDRLSLNTKNLCAENILENYLLLLSRTLNSNVMLKKWPRISFLFVLAQFKSLLFIFNYNMLQSFECSKILPMHFWPFKLFLCFSSTLVQVCPKCSIHLHSFILFDIFSIEMGMHLPK